MIVLPFKIRGRLARESRLGFLVGTVKPIIRLTPRDSTVYSMVYSAVYSSAYFYLIVYAFM
jgi:hypothetical protein